MMANKSRVVGGSEGEGQNNSTVNQSDKNHLSTAYTKLVHCLGTTRPSMSEVLEAVVKAMRERDGQRREVANLSE